jgi:hypothetical protein
MAGKPEKDDPFLVSMTPAPGCYSVSFDLDDKGEIRLKKVPLIGWGVFESTYKHKGKTVVCRFIRGIEFFPESIEVDETEDKQFLGYWHENAPLDFNRTEERFLELARERIAKAASWQKEQEERRSQSRESAV